jgi:hypothetical protein
MYYDLLIGLKEKLESVDGFDKLGLRCWDWWEEEEEEIIDGWNILFRNK